MSTLWRSTCSLGLAQTITEKLHIEMEIKRVFLSSTGRDLQVWRDATFFRLNVMPDVKVIRMEDFVASTSSPIETCKEAVEKCDVFVGLIGFNYGSTPKGVKKSFTEIEFDHASTLGLPRLMHVAPDTFAVTASLREDDVSHEHQVKFRKRLLTELTVGRSEHWADPQTLASFVAEAVRLTDQKKGDIFAVADLVASKRYRAAIGLLSKTDRSIDPPRRETYEVILRIRGRSLSELRLEELKEIRTQLQDLVPDLDLAALAYAVVQYDGFKMRGLREVSPTSSQILTSLGKIDLLPSDRVLINSIVFSDSLKTEIENTKF